MARKTIIPSDWTPDDGYTIGVFCLPNSVQWKSCVAGQINDLTYGRQWDINTGDVKAAQEAAERIMVTLSMDCGSIFSALTQAINSINTTLQNQSGCGCESVGTALPADPATGPPPIGPGEDFPDTEAYDTYKCQMAGSIMEALISSQRLLIDSHVQGYFQLSVVLITSAVTYCLSAAGFSDLLDQLGVASEVIFALATGEELNLENVRDRLTINRQDYTCDLFCATDADDARSQIVDRLAADESLSDTERAYVALYLQDVILNRLFSYQPDKLNLVISVDCGDCDCDIVPCAIVYQVSGATQLGSGAFRYDGVAFQIDSVPFPGEAFHSIHFLAPCDDPTCSGNWCVEFISTTADDTINIYSRTTECYTADCAGANITEFQFQTPSFPPLATPLNLAGFQINNPDPFSISMRITGPAQPCATDIFDDCSA